MLQDTVETLKQTCFQGYPESAGCVQGSIDSRNSAIHSAYRISLRPSSLFEPRHPSLKVVMFDVAPRGTDNSRVHRSVRGVGAGQDRKGARRPQSTPDQPRGNTDGRLQPFRDPHSKDARGFG